MRWEKLVAVLLMLVSGVAQAYHDWDEDEYQEVFRCESIGHGQSYCRLDVHADVVLVDQISRAPCIEGDTWGFDGRGVWVSDGCRGDFGIVYRGGRRGPGWGGGRGPGLPDPYPGQGGGWDGSGRGGAYAIVCESRDHGYNYCAVPIRGSVEIQEQLSDASCDEGDTWGYDRRGIWVDGGCRAEFVIYQ